jgi:hypothetical protein
MDDLPRRVVSESETLTGPLSPVGEPDPVLETARRRMRHLAPWRVEPMPLHRARGAAGATKPRGEDRNHRLALQVLALQMAEASSKGGLT